MDVCVIIKILFMCILNLISWQNENPAAVQSKSRLNISEVFTSHPGPLVCLFLVDGMCITHTGAKQQSSTVLCTRDGFSGRPCRRVTSVIELLFDDHRRTWKVIYCVYVDFDKVHYLCFYTKLKVSDLILISYVVCSLFSFQIKKC